MELRAFLEPQQGASYDQQVTMAKAVEDAGYQGFFRSDHFLAMSGEGLPGPTDAWLTLAAVAQETSKLRLGTLLTSATFRHPGMLAVQVAQVDAMSAGRVELGIGAGWFAEEHQAYGIPFPPVSERFDRLEEQLEVITGLWTTPIGGRFDHAGRYYQLSRSPALPKPVQAPRPPVIIGGYGPRRTPALAARFGDEFNVPFGGTVVTKEQFSKVRAACIDSGRDPGSLVYSVAIVVCCGEGEHEVERRAAAIGRPVAELAANGAAGTPEQVAAKLAEFAGIGASRVYLQLLDVDDLDHVRLIAERVVPLLP